MVDYKKVCECDSVAYCKGWNETVNAIITDRFVVVECVSTREVLKDQVIIGEKYRIDKGSLHIDYDGDVFVDVYGFDFKFIAHMKINHFIGVSD